MFKTRSQCFVLGVIITCFKFVIKAFRNTEIFTRTKTMLLRIQQHLSKTRLNGRKSGESLILAFDCSKRAKSLQKPNFTRYEQIITVVLNIPSMRKDDSYVKVIF